MDYPEARHVLHLAIGSARLLQRHASVGAWDAIHLALASSAGAAYFVTGDDGVLKRRRAISRVLQTRMKKEGPEEFVQEVTGEHGHGEAHQ